jgi:DNA invertase Pin-like site-specific DNA recombinase
MRRNHQTNLRNEHHEEAKLKVAIYCGQLQTEKSDKKAIADKAVKLGKTDKTSSKSATKKSEQTQAEMQMVAMREAAHRKGWQVEIEVNEIGPTFARRRDRSIVTNAVRQGRVKAIITPSLLCWSRSFSDLVNTLKELCAYDAEFYAVFDSITVSGEDGQALVEFLQVAKECEHQRRATQTSAGIKLAVRRGIAPGRPPKGEAFTGIVKMRRECGESVSNISDELGISRRTVYRLLQQ